VAQVLYFSTLAAKNLTGEFVTLLRQLLYKEVRAGGRG
jgi:hypothetical protein